jgi:hypothetical protein
MRFLKRQTINRRQLKSTTVYSDVTDANVYVNPSNSGSLVLPSGTNAQVPASPVNGMMRYNVDSNEVQVYQGSSWRSLRFKEATKITLQNLGFIDGYSYFYGPLNTLYAPANISSNNNTFGGQSLLVLLGNVLQIYNTNYTITQNPVASVATSAQSNNGAGTLTFTSTVAIPTGSVVTGSPYFQSNTIATVTNGTTVTLSKTISGGAVLSGTTITFTAPTGYYLNFTSDPNYSGLGANTTPINVLLGFDQ